MQNYLRKDAKYQTRFPAPNDTNSASYIKTIHVMFI